MNYEKAKSLILEEKLVVISRKVPMDKLADTARALVSGGVRILEVTFDQEADNPIRNYQESIEIIHDAVGDQLCLGAGTVLNEEQVQAAFNVGAEFILSPNTKKTVIQLTKKLGLVSVPGAMTPTEIVDAWDYGADIVKLFPADDLGYHFIWNIRGPLPHIPLLVTGGVNPKTIPEFLNAGVSAVGTGMTIIQRDYLNAGNYERIEKLAREHVETIKKYNGR